MDKSKRIYVDLEYIYPGMTASSGRPTENDLRQVVQIGAILFDMNRGKEEAGFDMLTRPAYTEKLPSFFVELTGITQENLNQEGVDFPAGFQKFLNFCSDYPIWTFDKDQGVLEQNCGYFGLEFSLPDFVRVKPKLLDWGVNPNKYSSGTLYQAAGLDMRGHVHNALHDVRSMAAAVYKWERDI
jgi:inhibitor of KinA sporulation pathway (predicted exonuclease)